MLDVKIDLVHPQAKFPTMGSEHAGAWDVYAASIEHDFGNRRVIVDLGFRLEPPFGYRVMIQPRSSLTKTQWIIQNSPALGDYDFRGVYKLVFSSFNDAALSEKTFPYKVGDRVAQLYLEQVWPLKWIPSSELSDTNRGEGGFGSTGR